MSKTKIGCKLMKRCILYNAVKNLDQKDYLVEIRGKSVPEFCDTVRRKNAKTLCSIADIMLGEE
jgi:hypothetical protein